MPPPHTLAQTSLARPDRCTKAGPLQRREAAFLFFRSSACDRDRLHRGGLPLWSPNDRRPSCPCDSNTARPISSSPPLPPPSSSCRVIVELLRSPICSRSPLRRGHYLLERTYSVLQRSERARGDGGKAARQLPSPSLRRYISPSPLLAHSRARPQTLNPRRRRHRRTHRPNDGGVDRRPRRLIQRLKLVPLATFRPVRLRLRVRLRLHDLSGHPSRPPARAQPGLEDPARPAAGRHARSHSVLIQ